jgi:hypothetical protein
MDKENEIFSPGWDAITNECKRVYKNQDNPIHYGTLISWDLGGDDPLEGISVYESEEYYHFVTYGLTELYDKSSSNKDVSGYGMEFTYKLKKGCYENLESEIKSMCKIFQQIARITFLNGEVFNEFEYLYTGQKEGLDSRSVSKITGFITVLDETFNSIDTVNGKVKFVEFIGVTDSELTSILNKQITVKELYAKLNSDVTDYSRESIV